MRRNNLLRNGVRVTCLSHKQKLRGSSPGSATNFIRWGCRSTVGHVVCTDRIGVRFSSSPPFFLFYKCWSIFIPEPLNKGKYMLIVIIVAVVGVAAFIAGVLVGRKNAKTVNTAVAGAQTVAATAQTVAADVTAGAKKL
jgi:hypothetical protein